MQLLSNEMWKPEQISIKNSRLPISSPLISRSVPVINDVFRDIKAFDEFLSFHAVSTSI